MNFWTRGSGGNGSKHVNSGGAEVVIEKDVCTR